MQGCVECGSAVLQSNPGGPVYTPGAASFFVTSYEIQYVARIEHMSTPSMTVGFYGCACNLLNCDVEELALCEASWDVMADVVLVTHAVTASRSPSRRRRCVQSSVICRAKHAAAMHTYAHFTSIAVSHACYHSRHAGWFCQAPQTMHGCGCMRLLTPIRLRKSA